MTDEQVDRGSLGLMMLLFLVGSMRVVIALAQREIWGAEATIALLLVIVPAVSMLRTFVRHRGTRSRRARGVD